MEQITIDQIKNNCLAVFLKYKRLCVQTKMQINEMRKTYVVFSAICDFIEYIWSILQWGFICSAYSAVEPTEPAWISVCKYYPSTFIGADKDYGFDMAVKDFVPARIISLPDGLQVAYPEKAQLNIEYIRFSAHYLEYWNKNAFQTNRINCFEHPQWRFYKKEYERECSPYVESNWPNDSLIVAKACPAAVRVRTMKNINLEEDLRELKPCRYKFVGVEYKCGSGAAIPIDIPKSHYIVGNELLSKAYILRHLEHRFPVYSNWEFNEKTYSVCILDSNFNTITIKGVQYILLEEEGYVVK